MESDMKKTKASPEVENNYDWKVLLDFWSTLQLYEEFKKEIMFFKPCPHTNECGNGNVYMP